MADIPDIPFSSRLHRITNAKGDTYSIAVTAQAWHEYAALSPITGVNEQCVAVLYESDEINIGTAMVPDQRQVVFAFAWNLNTARTYIERHINLGVAPIAQFYFGESPFSGRARPFPVLWPLSNELLTLNGFARGPLRYLRPVPVNVAAFSEWVPRMNYTP